LHQLSIEEYHRIVACGGFAQDTRVELIDGLEHPTRGAV
jgi:hypothetical protein